MISGNATAIHPIDAGVGESVPASIHPGELAGCVGLYPIYGASVYANSRLIGNIGSTPVYGKTEKITMAGTLTADIDVKPALDVPGQPITKPLLDGAVSIEPVYTGNLQAPHD